MSCDSSGDFKKAPMWTSERGAHSENLKPSIVSFRSHCPRGDRIGVRCVNVIRNPAKFGSKFEQLASSTTTVSACRLIASPNTGFAHIASIIGPRGYLAFHIRAPKSPQRSYGCTAKITTPRNTSATTTQLMMNLSRM
jgi:hypothetical protein